jgi:hypothetical protein
MKNFNRRAISAALLMTLGLAFSVNASAAQTSSIENSLTEMVITQNLQVISDLSAQLQQSIEEELSSFSIDFSFDESVSDSLAWLSGEQATPVVEEAKQSEQAKSN